jgi:hypothetical protein
MDEPDDLDQLRAEYPGRCITVAWTGAASGPHRRSPAARTGNIVNTAASAAELARKLLSVPVVAELLEGSYDAGAQSVVAAVRVQDACSLLTAQDFHHRHVDYGRCEVLGCC